MRTLSSRLPPISGLLVMGALCTATGTARADDAPAAAAATAAPEPATDPDAKLLAKNSVYAEGLGAAIAYSLNYERMVIDEVGVRLGFSYLSVGSSASAGGSSASSSATYLWFPITASYVGLRSSSGNALEAGAGVTLLYVSGQTSAAGIAASSAGIVPYGVALLGFRHQPVGHAGFMFRIGANALFAPGLGLQNPSPGTLGVIPWPYISLGASF